MSFYRYGSAGHTHAEQLAAEECYADGVTGYRPIPMPPTAEALRIEALMRLTPVLSK